MNMTTTKIRDIYLTIVEASMGTGTCCVSLRPDEAVANQQLFRIHLG